MNTPKVNKNSLKTDLKTPQTPDWMKKEGFPSSKNSSRRNLFDNSSFDNSRSRQPSRDSTASQQALNSSDECFTMLDSQDGSLMLKNSNKLLMMRTCNKIIQEDQQSDSDKEGFCSKFVADQTKELSEQKNHQRQNNHHESFHHQRLVRTSGITPQKKVIRIKKLITEPPLLTAHAGCTPRKPTNLKNGKSRATPRMPKLTRAVVTPVKGNPQYSLINPEISPDTMPVKRRAPRQICRSRLFRKSPREEGELSSEESSTEDEIEVLSPNRKSGQVRVRTIVRKYK